MDYNLIYKNFEVNFYTELKDCKLYKVKKYIYINFLKDCNVFRILNELHIHSICFNYYVDHITINMDNLKELF